MRLNLERDGDAVADVNDAGVFLARADKNLGRLGGEGLEQRLGVFVAAMLAPHHGKDAKLGVARRAAEDFHGMGVFFRREVVLGNQLWGDGGFGHGKLFKKIILSKGVVRPVLAGNKKCGREYAENWFPCRQFCGFQNRCLF